MQKEDACDRKKWRRLIHCVESDGDDSGDQEGIEPSDGSPRLNKQTQPMPDGCIALMKRYDVGHA